MLNHRTYGAGVAPDRRQPRVGVEPLKPAHSTLVSTNRVRDVFLRQALPMSKSNQVRQHVQLSARQSNRVALLRGQIIGVERIIWHGCNTFPSQHVAVFRNNSLVPASHTLVVKPPHEDVSCRPYVPVLGHRRRANQRKRSLESNHEAYDQPAELIRLAVIQPVHQPGVPRSALQFTHHMLRGHT